MHPYIQSGKHILILGLIWSPFCLSVVLFASFVFNYDILDSMFLFLPPLFFILIFSLSTWYLCKIRPVRETSILMTAFIHFLSATILNALWLAQSYGYAFLLNKTTKMLIWTARFEESFAVWVAIGYTVYFLSVLFHYLVMAIESTREAERDALEKDILAVRSELRALKSSIHPHFLFNSLTALEALIRKDKNKAERVANLLSGFLQYSMKHSRTDVTTVRDEVEHIRTYLDIEKIRLGKRLKIKIEIQKQCERAEILSLLLIPLVENSIKHGISQCLETGTLEVQISKQNSRLHIKITNPYDPDYKARVGEGLGLRIIKERMSIHYGSGSSMRTETDDGFYIVNIWIPFTERKR